jgi:hypothetical protein
LLVGLAARTAYNAAGKSAPDDHGHEHAH